MEQCSSISHSPKGWTDQELGSKWLERDFEPATAARNPSGGYRLLILDGHNSHCTYAFCTFAEKHNIIVVCLPSHTTHILQPCDVGVFGPLSKLWKSQVNKATCANITVTSQSDRPYGLRYHLLTDLFLPFIFLTFPYSANPSTGLRSPSRPYCLPLLFSYCSPPHYSTYLVS